MESKVYSLSHDDVSYVTLEEQIWQAQLKKNIPKQDVCSSRGFDKWTCFLQG